MNLTIFAVDKLREPYLREGCEQYMRRLEPHLPVSIVEVKPAGMEAESKAMLARIGSDSIVWALDREGQMLSSPELSARLREVGRSGARRLSLLIGGADGLHADCTARADFRWSLSELTFLHEMARLIALEQLYRATKIARGEPYHR